MSKHEWYTKVRHVKPDISGYIPGFLRRRRNYDDIATRLAFGAALYVVFPS